MAVSSGPVFVSAGDSSISVAAGMEAEESLYVEDEEFPSDLATNYDRMFQPKAQRFWPGILLVAALAVLIVVVSVHIH